MYYTEAKPQGWRAVAVLHDQTERLIYLSSSSNKVRSGYQQAFLDLFDEEDREQVSSISLQRWDGAPDAGRWIHHTNLNVPAMARLARSA